LKIEESSPFVQIGFVRYKLGSKGTKGGMILYPSKNKTMVNQFFFYPPSSSIMPSFPNTSLKKHTHPSTIKAILSLGGTIRT
jgi:hypothetical protein